MGFAVGGSFFWGLYGPNTTIEQISQRTEHHAAEKNAQSKKEETDEALANYTLWLMVFTGILAVATVGLGGATLGLYFTGEKQIRFNAEAAAAQSSAMEASIQAATRSAEVAERTMVLNDRPWVKLTVDIAGPFSFLEDECRIDIKIVLENIGRSPAMKTGFHIVFGPIDSMAEKHHQLVDYAASVFDMISYGRTLFPGEKREFERTYWISRGTIEEAIKNDEGHRFRPTIVACTYYGLPTGGRFRHTSLCFEVVDKKYSDYGFSGQVSNFPAEEVELLNALIGATT